MQSRERGKMRMTLKELKAEAKKRGYKLVKDSRAPKFNPCTCGCKVLEKWVSRWPDGNFYYLVCKKCGKKSGYGKTQAEAVKQWNEMIESEMKNG